MDDNLGDVYLLQKTLLKCGVNNVDTVLSGEDAAKYIIGVAPFVGRAVPELIFLDLKLLGMDGFQLLTWIKGEALFSRIPVVIFSGTIDPFDRLKALQLGAHAFFHKTQRADKLMAIVEEVLQFSETPPTSLHPAKAAARPKNPPSVTG